MVLWVCVSCSPDTAQSSSARPAGTNLQTYPAAGVIISLQPDGKTAKIKHEKIPGYMDAMTMDFEVRDTNELRGLSAGDAVSFRMLVTDKDGWIDQVKKLAPASVAKPPSNTPPISGPFRLVRDVEPLLVGDLLPEYRFTNQLGEAFTPTQFKGKALAITFIFTRCPFPTYCPRMSLGFAETQQKLLSQNNAPTNWHLLTLSFDPDFDTPAVLKSYADRNGYDPKHWTFGTGALIDLTAITEQFGLTFWRDEQGGLINHNLRTVVLDTAGRVRTNFVGNSWTSDELAAAIIEAAQSKK